MPAGHTMPAVHALSAVHAVHAMPDVPALPAVLPPLHGRHGEWRAALPPQILAASHPKTRTEDTHGALLWQNPFLSKAWCTVIWGGVGRVFPAGQRGPGVPCPERTQRDGPGAQLQGAAANPVPAPGRDGSCGVPVSPLPCEQPDPVLGDHPWMGSSQPLRAPLSGFLSCPPFLN